MSIRTLAFVAAFVVVLPFALAQSQKAISAAGPASTSAATPMATLTIGDAAPALTIEKWIKGSPVARFEKGKVYMIEFWATWCPPCIAGMPHLSELQKKYKDRGLTIIGVSSVDTKGNTLEKAEKMTAEKGDVMGYTVAWDTDRKTNDAWFKAAGQRGIPCAFLVDGNGLIAYIGHPMKIDETVEQVVAGKHDIRALAESYKHDKEIDARSEPIQAALNEAIKGQDWPTAIAKADELMALDAKKFGSYANLKFGILTRELKEIDKAYAFAREFWTGPSKDDVGALNGIAWTIVDPKGTLARQDLDLALEFAERAVELTKSENALILATLARVHFVRGDLKKAVDIETKAAEKEPSMKKTLDEYKDALGKKAGG